MMKIASRYRPFLHKPGGESLIPGTLIVVRAYPTKLIIQEENGQIYHFIWNLKGLIKDFTLMQDLETRAVYVSGFTEDNFFKYKIFINDQIVTLKLERSSFKSLEVKFCSKEMEVSLSLNQNSSFKIFRTDDGIDILKSVEKLSFGQHKAQDWELVVKRKNPQEYLPFWFSLGQLSPLREIDDHKPPILEHLFAAKKALRSSEKEDFLQKLHEIFLCGFQGLLVPLQEEQGFSGLNLSSAEPSQKHCYEILHYGYQLIKEMILSIDSEKITFLTNLPSLFHSGRALNFSLCDSLFDIEWSKKILKKVHLTVFTKKNYFFSFQNSLKTFRLKEKSSKKGSIHSCFEPLTLEPGFYTLDQFKK